MNTDWHKSTYSNTGGNCVEARAHGSGAEVRDSQNPNDGSLELPAREWNALLNTLHAS
ncbi:DUF397 domain-containing protein [Nocardiopsis alba]|uniref:DUF397 domain-containing protein n=1 Tax=Nocardiopsis alba (strain ATCC BAA-2165 / BE74) TaxID=1205910 RepID=J7L103_NOCAA|nr:DUF397 domain-containing protein [Nocardiopsis alba]AFR07338.1 hypothetical protein B005_4401 [Nocardiopsis alba ATCC BAA-2165]